MFYAAVLALGLNLRNRRRARTRAQQRSNETSVSTHPSSTSFNTKVNTSKEDKNTCKTDDCNGCQSFMYTWSRVSKLRMEILECQNKCLLEINASLHDENKSLRRIAALLSKSARIAMLDLVRDTESVSDGRGARLSVGSIESRPRRSSSQGRLPSLATLTRINLRFNKEQHFGGLHRAVLSGREDDVEFLLSAGKDINAHDEYGKTPLHCAVGIQKLDIVLCLLRHKPDIDAHDDREDAPLHTAIRTGNIAIVTAILIDGRADPNSCGHAGCTPLHVAAQLDHVNNNAICKLLLENGAKLLSRDHKYMTPLALATVHGFYDVMVCLFSYATIQGIPKDDLLHEVDGEGSTLLHLAVESSSARVVELCLDEGAAPHSVKASDGCTPVHLACSYGYMDILDILMKAVAFILDPPPDQDGRLPIHKAAQANHHSVLAYLLKQDVDQIDAVDHEGCTPIMLAAENGCYESVRVLLENRANIDIRDGKNRTVLHYAIGGADVMKEILKDVKSTSLIRAKDFEGNTPLHYAAGRGCVKDISLMLMKYKASVAITNVNGEIPLHIASRNGWLAVVKKLTEGRNKRTINNTDANERTPLHLSAREGHEELIEFFLRKNAKIDRDNNGQTPLHYAAHQGSLRSVELFLEAKPETLNITDEERNTALHMAAMGGHPNVVRLLLAKSEQLVSVNERNQNVLDIAIEGKHEAVAMVIAEHKRWREVLRGTLHGTHTQIQLLVRHMPDVAKKFLDRCVETEGDPDDENYKVTYDLRFIQGMPEDKKNKSIRDSLSALHTMVKYKTLPCLTHPLCSVLMDIKWRKFGLVCAFLNQGVFFVYIILIVFMMDYLVENHKKLVDENKNALNKTDVRMAQPLIVTAFEHNIKMAIVSVILMIACIYNLSKEGFQIFDEGWKYFLSLNNWLEVTLYVLTFVTLVNPGLAEMAVCVFLAWIVLLHYFSKFNYVGLYIVMIRKTIKTVLKVLIILLILLAAFAFSFHVITVNLKSNSSRVRFHNVPTALAATFFMMLDNLQYETIVLEYKNTSTGEGVVLYGLFIGYCFMMPIIFLNLLIGLAVGDIDNIRKTAAMERYTSQVEHLSQLERALPTFILSKAQVQEYVEYPNRHKKVKDKIVDFLVKLLSPRQEVEKKNESQTDMDEKIARHETQLKQINLTLKTQSALLEELKDLLIDKQKRQSMVVATAAPQRPGEEPPVPPTDGASEFYV